MYDFNYLALTAPDAFWSYLRGLKHTGRVTFPPIFSVTQTDFQSPCYIKTELITSPLSNSQKNKSLTCFRLSNIIWDILIPLGVKSWRTDKKRNNCFTSKPTALASFKGMFLDFVNCNIVLYRNINHPVIWVISQYQHEDYQAEIKFITTGAGRRGSSSCLTGILARANRYMLSQYVLRY